MSAIRATEPAVATATVMTRMSPLRMWAISWAITPSSSWRFILSIRPVVTATTALSTLRPVANALGEGSWTTKTRGGGMPAARETSATRLLSCGKSRGSASTARVARSASVSLWKYDVNVRPNETTTPMITPMMPPPRAREMTTPTTASSTKKPNMSSHVRRRLLAIRS